MSCDYEVLVIGAGPGGYVAAIQAAKEGKKTAIVEGRHFGGTCLNIGCIPTKALIKGANIYHAIQSAAKYGVEGIDLSRVAVNMTKLQANKEGVVKQLVQGVRGLLAANKVTVLNGTARFADEHTLLVNDKSVTADHIIIATGSKVSIPGFIAQEGTNNIVTSDEMLSISQLPKSVVIIGGGVIGVEFAYLLNRLGVKVTVVELMDRILPMVDKEISDMAKARLVKDGVTFYLGAKVQKIRDNQVIFQYESQEKAVPAQLILMAVGRSPNTDGLNAEKIGLEFDRKAIKADAHLRTNIPHIYAIGDVNGKVMLAHTASGEGEVAMDCICGRERIMHYDRIPSCIYLEPEIACIGLTEEQARETYGDAVKVGKFPVRANGKSLVEGETDGMFKLILDSRYGEILGAHLYGLHVTEMISEIALAMQAEATAEELIHMIHPHPTVNESMGEVARSAWLGSAIHWV